MNNISEEQSIFRLKKEIKDYKKKRYEKYKQLVEDYEKIIKNYDELIKKSSPSKINIYEQKKYKKELELDILKKKFIEEKKKNKKVYEVVIKLILFPGENPSIIDKQKYKCVNSFEKLKEEYCEVFGVGCVKENKNKKVGGTMKNRIVKNKKYTLKNIYFK